MDFSEWSRREIDRLRKAALENTLQADNLEHALAKYESELKAASAPPAPSIKASGPVKIGGGVRKRISGASKGDKSAYNLKLLHQAGNEGASLDQLYQAFVHMFGSSYKRSSLRAMVFHQKKEGKIIQTWGGRYALPEFAPKPAAQQPLPAIN